MLTKENLRTITEDTDLTEARKGLLTAWLEPSSGGVETNPREPRVHNAKGSSFRKNKFKIPRLEDDVK
jgi:hypothetical protein